MSSSQRQAFTVNIKAFPLTTTFYMAKTMDYNLSKQEDTTKGISNIMV